MLYANSVEGLDELIRNFNKLGESDKHKSLIMAATKKSANRILTLQQKYLMSNGSIRTGKLFSSLHVKQLSVKSKKYAKDTLYVSYGIGPRYATMLGPKGVNYGHLVELGHDIRVGPKKAFKLRAKHGRSDAKPFMRPAGDDGMSEHVENVVDALNKALEEFGRG